MIPGIQYYVFPLREREKVPNALPSWGREKGEKLASWPSCRKTSLGVWDASCDCATFLRWTAPLGCRACVCLLICNPKAPVRVGCVGLL